ncbi:acetamidase [Morchella snyderi]|nr:acetamidase [Morchella snyderi]
MSTNWRVRVEAKRTEVNKLYSQYRIPRESLKPDTLPQDLSNIFSQGGVGLEFLTAREKTMTEEPNAVVVLGMLRRGEWSCTELVTAYIKRVTIITQFTNTLTEPLFPSALARAKELDALPADQRGPLHGLPLTVKDQFHVPGSDSTIGYVSYIGNASMLPPSVLTEMLGSLGAIIFAKTNLPQSIMWCETKNNIFRCTHNPRNKSFTPGGSSGGEAVNLYMCGSLVGWGTDIGGSIRIPSALMGTYGLKPSSTRLPYEGVVVSTEGQEHVPSVVGPMARSMSSLKMITKAVIDAEPWNLDPKVAPIPWREDVYQDTLQRKLVFGVLRDDGVVRVHPPIKRVLENAMACLEAAGHEVVEWAPYGHDEAVAIMDEFYRADGGEDIRRALDASGEPAIPHVARLIDRGPAISVYEYWQLNKRKWACQKGYFDRWNASSELSRSKRMVDLILSPVMPHVAVPHGKCQWVGYTKVWNVMDYTAGVVPGGFVDRAKDPEQKYRGRSDLDDTNWKLYDPQLMHGHPVGLQVIGRRLQEEKVLAGMEVLEEVLGGNHIVQERVAPRD